MKVRPVFVDRHRQVYAFAALALIVFAPSVCLAIPSPDVVVNLFASAGQVLGLLSVLFGTAALKGGKGRGSAVNNRSTVSSKLMIISVLLLLTAIIVCILQYTWYQQAVTRRLEANLIRPSFELGKKVGDINLKTLSFSDQLSHPAAIHGEELAKELADPDFKIKYSFVDVRTPEEFEMGFIEGITSIPQPDLRARREEVLSKDRPIVLICDSGNRSGELCSDFNSQGYSCRFVIGGYEKWLAEGRALHGVKPRSSGQIRDIPEYPNKHVLLDTPDVESLIQTRNAIFVDVRYPGDFELGHLPGAINIPLRKMRTEEGIKALKELPPKPVIAPCYDKRSCFFSLVLGLRLTRLGYEYLGRYTVPHEYMQAAPELEFIKQWREDNEKTLLSFLRDPLLLLFKRIESLKFGFLASIIIFVALLRMALLPFSVKAERDGIVERKFRPELEGWRAELAGDPVRLSRATRRWYKVHKLTPAVTLLGSSLQVIIFIVAFTVIQRASKSRESAFLWLPQPSSEDPYFILPLIVSAFFFGFLALNAKRRDKMALSFRAAFTVLLFVITAPLSAALNFYLAVNLGLMLAQTFIIRAVLARYYDSAKEPGTVVEELHSDEGVFPLSMAHRVVGAGAKASRLGQMLEAGLPVPNGFVITEPLFTRNGMALDADELKLSQRDAHRLVELRSSMKSRCVAVRSSGLNEDGSENSYAGVFESILNVKPYEFGSAVQDVRASLSSQRVLAYSGVARERGGILVQEMIDAEYAGVLFTEHPAQSGAMLVELIKGLADALVSGASSAHAFRFGRISGECLDNHLEPPIDLTPLIKLGWQIEKLFGAPQDIEWTYSAGEFRIIQARNITRHSRTSSREGNIKATLEDERHRLLQIVKGAKKDEVVFAQNELSELLPRPTPFSLSLMERLRRPGGSTDLACRALGIPYDMEENSPPLFVSVFGALYINKIQERNLGMQKPGFMSSYRLGRSAESLERELREEFIPAVTKHVRLIASIDLDKFSLRELTLMFIDWLQRYITETYVIAEKINLAAEFYLKTAQHELERKGFEPARYLAHVPTNITFEAFALLPQIKQGKRSVDEFIEIYGHRSPYDYELSTLRYSEYPELVAELVKNSGDNTHTNASQGTDEISSRVLEAIVSRACKFQALKEDAKHTALMELAQIRRITCAIGQVMGIGQDIFYLNSDQVAEMVDIDKARALGDKAVQTKRRFGVFSQIRVPTQVTMSQLETLEVFADGSLQVLRNGAVASRNGALNGILVAGDRTVEGQARVILEEDEMLFFRKGEILVTRFTNPKWTPLFSQAGGIVTEVGGWLSHAAILAREFNLPTIVGVSNVLECVNTGDKIRLKMDGSVELVH